MEIKTVINNERSPFDMLEDIFEEVHEFLETNPTDKEMKVHSELLNQKLKDNLNEDNLETIMSGIRFATLRKIEKILKGER